MPDHQISYSLDGKSPRTKDEPERANTVGSTGDIHNFLAQLSSREQTSLPQNPWVVPEGNYTRPDGSVLYTRGPDHFQGYGLQSLASESVQVLTGNEDVCQNKKK